MEDDVKDVNSLDKLADHFSENEIDLHDYSETVTVFENPVPEFLENVDDEDMDDHDNDDDDNDSTYEPPKEEVSLPSEWRIFAFNGKLIILRWREMMILILR